MMQIGAVNLNSVFEERKFRMLKTFISTEKRERINLFYRYEDAQRTLIGDILARYLICKRLSTKNHELVFETNSYGKPFLSNYNDVYFSISHSGNWVVCCVNRVPVGIDVEQIKLIDVKDISERFFSKDEENSFMRKSANERYTYFYDLWTLKESYVKVIGKGFSIPLDSFTIKINENCINLCSKDEKNDYYFRRYKIDENYKMAVCSRENKFPLDIDFVNVNKLYEEILLLE